MAIPWDDRRFDMYRFLYLIIWVIFATSVSHGSQKYVVRNTLELKTALDTILFHLKRKPNKLEYTCNRITMMPGFYSVFEEDQFFIILRDHLMRRGLSEAMKARMVIFADYPWPYHDEKLFEGTYIGALKYLDREIKKGLKISQDIVYTTRSVGAFYKALSLASKNNQDTVIRAPFCRKVGCIKNEKWQRRFKALSMEQDDGMRLRIQTAYCSYDQPKITFYQKNFDPFLIP